MVRSIAVLLGLGILGGVCPAQTYTVTVKKSGNVTEFTSTAGGMSHS